MPGDDLEGSGCSIVKVLSRHVPGGHTSSALVCRELSPPTSVAMLPYVASQPMNLHCCEHLESHSTELDMKSSIFWNIKPCSRLKFEKCFWREFRLHLQNQRIHPEWSKYQEELSSELSAGFQWTVLHCVPEDRSVHNHRCETWTPAELNASVIIICSHILVRYFDEIFS